MLRHYVTHIFVNRHFGTTDLLEALFEENGSDRYYHKVETASFCSSDIMKKIARGVCELTV